MTTQTTQEAPATMDDAVRALAATLAVLDSLVWAIEREASRPESTVDIDITEAQELLKRAGLRE